MIAQTLWVTSDRFEATTPGEHFINPRCFGEDFANWLHSALKERGYDVSDPIQEDFGWVLLVTVVDRKFTISVGIMDESIRQTPAQWCIAVAYEKPLNPFRTWLKSPPTESFDALFKDVRTALEAEADFQVSDDEQ
jgi:hypothetical protein